MFVCTFKCVTFILNIFIISDFPKERKVKPQLIYCGKSFKFFVVLCITYYLYRGLNKTLLDIFIFYFAESTIFIIIF